MRLTPSQAEAVLADGNVLVMAGAGTGKTRTLVERCLHRLLNADPRCRVPLDRMLIVTFTEAAATEIRHRIRERLEEEFGKARGNSYLAEQLALVDTAAISTLHSFCWKLIRQHFFELGLDPRATVLTAEQSSLLAERALDAIWEECYRAGDAMTRSLEQFIQDQGRGRDDSTRDLILRLHKYTQTLKNPAGWLELQHHRLAQPSPDHWRSWLLDAFQSLRSRWLPLLSTIDHPVCAASARILERISTEAAGAEMASALGAILGADQDWPRGTKTRVRPRVERFFDAVGFLASLANGAPGHDPMEEDWAWARPHLATLLELTKRFAARFDAVKRDAGGLDFHDLEQGALRLLLDRDTGMPGMAAQQWIEQFDLVFVDEYQDINEAQDAILTALSRSGERANRFLVGDLKQSIYRFRLANPRIFRGYLEAWKNGENRGHVLSLSENFRSNPAILRFVNAFFSGAMQEEIGGVTYGPGELLRSGLPSCTGDVEASPPVPRVEVQLQWLGAAEPAREGSRSTHRDVEGEDYSAAEREALMIGRRLIALREEGVVLANGESAHRFEWSEMVVLLRSPKGKTEGFARVFSRLGIPFSAPRRGFFESSEISDLMNTLRLLDNPRQDLPLLAVLRSPLAGFSVDELALMRLQAPGGKLWSAFERFAQPAGAQAGGQPVTESQEAESRLKASRFLALFLSWRGLLRTSALSHCVEQLLVDTGYRDWLMTQQQPLERLSNLERFLELTRQFDPFLRHGLYRFIRFIEATEKSGVDVEPAAPEAAQAVRLMSIHQSKGLEFPVVVVADLGKPFNFNEDIAGVLIDEQFGLCPMVKPPQTASRYPSLPFWLARHRQRAETLGEELRLLYVAFTRTEKYLVLAGTAVRGPASRQWVENADPSIQPTARFDARCCLDWLGPWFTSELGGADGLSTNAGSSPNFIWRTVGQHDLKLPPPSEKQMPIPPTRNFEIGEPDPAIQALRRKLAWRYPLEAASQHPSKLSVSSLRRQQGNWESEPAEAASADFGSPSAKYSLAKVGLAATDVGLAHHRFLECARLERLTERAAIGQEIQRLISIGSLSEIQAETLDQAALSRFWSSVIGRRLLAARDNLHRELPFTMAIQVSELVALNLVPSDDVESKEKLILQGVVDLTMISPTEIWILDFKTDRISRRDLPDRVLHHQTQLRLYSLALGRIYNRPVTQAWLHFLKTGDTVPMAL